VIPLGEHTPFRILFQVVTNLKWVAMLRFSAVFHPTENHWVAMLRFIQYRQVEQADIEKMLNFKSLVEHNEAIIKRYFDDGATNAIAENINSKIKRFILINQGTRDREFFYFRLRNYFT
jgi:hypothetical protein